MLQAADVDLSLGSGDLVILRGDTGIPRRIIVWLPLLVSRLLEYDN